jgi:uncharacterized protein YdcH (DUF465 family)
MRQIERLARNHALLDERIDELDRRLTLTMAEQYLLRTLKKKKLAVKDELVRAREDAATAGES